MVSTTSVAFATTLGPTPKTESTPECRMRLSSLGKINNFSPSTESEKLFIDSAHWLRLFMDTSRPDLENHPIPGLAPLLQSSGYEVSPSAKEYMILATGSAALTPENISRVRNLAVRDTETYRNLVHKAIKSEWGLRSHWTQ